METKETKTESVANEVVNNNAIVKETVQSPVKKKFNKQGALFNKEWCDRVPETTRNLVYLIRNNTEIRRFTALGIINYLLQKGEIKGNKKYVDFLWNKFRVKVDGITREFLYTEPFFLNCLVASFASFSASAQRTINAFCKAEMSVCIDKACDTEEINEIISSNEQHQDEIENAVE